MTRALAGLFFVLTLVLGSSTLSAADVRYQTGPLKAHEAIPAPEWTVSKWFVGPELKLSELRGQVVVIDFFQLWCPGCKRFSIPLMTHWEKAFAEEIKADRMKLISIHTVFEGHSYQTEKKLIEFIKEKKMNHPVGWDHLPAGERIPKTMQDYQTRGTPEIAIIDKAGRLRFQKLGGFDASWATDFIKVLLKENAES